MHVNLPKEELGFSKPCSEDSEFPPGGGVNPVGWGPEHTICQILPKNCMKMKEFGRPGVGACVQNFTMYIRQCKGRIRIGIRTRVPEKLYWLIQLQYQYI